MPSIVANLNLNNAELQNAKIHLLASDPGSPPVGLIWYNTTSNQLKYQDNAGTKIIANTGGISGVATLTATGPLTNTGTSTDPVIALKTGSQAGAANGISNTHIASDAAIALSKLATDPLARGNHTGTQLASTISDFDAQVRTSRLDQMAVPTADLNLNSRKITGLADPTNAQDAVTKLYADGLIQGVRWKQPVRAASTANVTLASAVENGDALDGVTIATGDRVLLKNQTAPAENGIYTVNATGAPTRATDADIAAEILGAAVFVSEGTTNGNTSWIMTTDAPITLGTTGLVWAQISGVGTFTAGTGLSLTGTQFALSTPVSVANGGTNATTAAGARTNLGATTKFSQDVGDGSSTAIVVTHNLGTRDIDVQVYRSTTPWDKVYPDIEMTSTNTITLRFATAPTSNQYRVVVIG